MEKQSIKKRRNIFRASLGMLLGIPLIRWVYTDRNPTLKFLTRDGKLVEIPKAILGKSTHKKASKSDLINWVNHKTSKS